MVDPRAPGAVKKVEEVHETTVVPGGAVPAPGVIDTSRVIGREVNLNPAGLPDGKEFKYERVETAKVDASGHADVVDVREDRGGEDPGMNYKDKRPDVPPGVPIGVIPTAASRTGTAPEIPAGLPGPFVQGGDPSRHDAIVVGNPPHGGRQVVEEHRRMDDNVSVGSGAGKTVIKEKEKVAGPGGDAVTKEKKTEVKSDGDKTVVKEKEKSKIH